MVNVNRDLPRVIHSSMALVTTLFTLANVAYFIVLSKDVIASSNTVALVRLACAQIDLSFPSSTTSSCSISFSAGLRLGHARSYRRDYLCGTFRFPLANHSLFKLTCSFYSRFSSPSPASAPSTDPSTQLPVSSESSPSKDPSHLRSVS
jgi:hypothetical protein